MNKKGWVKLSKMRLLYYGLGILTGCFVLWISLSEGKRLHYLDMEICHQGSVGRAADEADNSGKYQGKNIR